ncbi:DUF6318 family protein [Nocardioides insulae]|uniref:DUF6318 family protein n=1 Tax=Nocardioides insulae TaxID=394734 RepID=UPI0024808AFC|nr:DUF6318 family protein [Nocardioides insulae]
MRRPHAPLAALATAALLLGTTACQDDTPTASPSPAPSTSTATTPSPTTPQPPVMPDAARQHTKAGAIAFAKHFFATSDYAQSHLDPNSVSALSSPTCAGCNGGIESIRRVKRANGSYSGGETRPTNFKVEGSKAGNLVTYEVTADLYNTKQEISYPGKRKREVYPPGTITIRLTLIPHRSDWQVAILEEA